MDICFLDWKLAIYTPFFLSTAKNRTFCLFLQPQRSKDDESQIVRIRETIPLPDCFLWLNSDVLSHAFPYSHQAQRRGKKVFVYHQLTFADGNRLAQRGLLTAAGIASLRNIYFFVDLSTTLVLGGNSIGKRRKQVW